MTLKRSETGVLNPLPKGRSCSTCKARKVRCDAQIPACSSCLRSARFEHRDTSLVCCQYKEKKLKGDKKKEGQEGMSEGGKVKKVRKTRKCRAAQIKEDEIVNTSSSNFNFPPTIQQVATCSYPPLDYSLVSNYPNNGNSFKSTSTHSKSDDSESGYYTPIDSPVDGNLLDFDHPYISTPSTSNFNSIYPAPEFISTTLGNSYLPTHPFYHPQLQQQPLLLPLDPMRSFHMNPSSIPSLLPPPQTQNNSVPYIMENENFPSTTSNLNLNLPLNFGGNDKIEFEGYFGIDGLLASGKGSYEGVFTEGWNPGMWC